MSRILKRKEWDRNDLLQIALYHDFIQKNEDGWFNVDEIINYISGIRRCQNKPEYDFQTLEKHVYNDVDHRYIFNEDKTLLRISPDHISPKYVEEELKNAGTIKIKQSVFKKNNLEFVKDETRKIIITSGNGRRWFFPYETNRIFYIDDKRFFMPVELTRGSAVAVSAYLNKHTKYSYQYRMAFIDFPAVLNYIHALNSELADYEGNTYRICIEQVSEQAVEKTTDKSLEELENDYWDKPGYKSYVVTTCFAARKKPLSELSNEEIRLLIGQKLGLKYLLPLAIDILKTDPLIEVTFYPGDLLYQLLKLDFKDWIDNKEERDSLLKIVINNRSKIEENTEIPEDRKKEMLELLSGIENYDRHRNS